MLPQTNHFLLADNRAMLGVRPSDNFGSADLSLARRSAFAKHNVF
jgi:hypothetical protein